MKKPLGSQHDAFGHMLLDYLDGGAGHELIERDDGFIALSAGAETYFSEPTEEQREVVDHATGRILDVGCGAGRFALYLQEKGLDVVGIDVSPLAVEVCRRRGLREAHAMSIGQVDSSVGWFDTVLMLGNNLALLESAGSAEQILTRLHKVVSPGGRIIGNTLDPYQTDDPDHLAYHAMNHSKGRMGGQIRMRVRYKKYKSPWFDYLFLSLSELGGILERTDWRLGQVLAKSGPGYAVLIERQGD